MVGDKKVVVPIRTEPPTSAVMPVARKISGAGIVSPVELMRRAYRDLVDGAAKAYDQAAKARGAGDLVGAALLVNAAARALGEAQAIGERLVGL